MNPSSHQPSTTPQDTTVTRWWPLWTAGTLFYVACAAYSAGWLVSALTAQHAHPMGNAGVVAVRMLLRGVDTAWHPAPNSIATWILFVFLVTPGAWVLWRFGLGRLLEDGTPHSVDGAHWAGPHDEQRLVVPDDRNLRPGRMVAGRSLHGRHRLLAGEDCASVTAFGTSGAGKTFRLLVPNLLEWQGPAIMSTTRGPDLDALIARRSELGPCWIIAPGGVAGHDAACWSPVDYAIDEASAFRMADWLATAAQDRIGAAEENRPWVEQATSLIAPLLLAAHLSGGGIEQFVRWVRAGTEAEHAVIQHLTAAGYETVARELTTLRHIHDRGQGSVRFTAFTITRPYRMPEVLASAARTDIDVNALIDQCGTVFLVSPVSEAIYAPMFTALTASILHEATKRYEATGNALDPRLGVFLDEAGNVFRYARLAALLTNVRAMGIELMTIWHDLAQLETLYGPTEARTILSQSRMRMLLPGVADDHTLDYFSALIGQTVLERPSRTIATDGRNSASAAPHTEPLAPAWRLAQQPAGTAVVQYDNLPATRVKLRDYFADPELQQLADAPTARP